MKKVKALGLFSGGLDSIISVKVVQEQGIEVTGVTYVTPFFGPEKARAAAEQIGIPLLAPDITEEHLAMLLNPRYGYGKNMNPCIDCHTLMLSRAGRIMKETGADFLFTGEVLGQRPMSQNRHSLHIVAKNSGYEEFIVRPLSALLLPETKPEKEGMLDRHKLLDISGRGRKRQMELAARYGISTYSNPAGGCLLTDPGFSRKLRDLFESGSSDIREIKLLKYGRHFRSGTFKIIAGRNRDDNMAIKDLASSGDALINACDYPGPLVIVPGGGDRETLELAASICARYCDGPQGEAVRIKITIEGREEILSAFPAAQAALEALLV